MRLAPSGAPAPMIRWPPRSPWPPRQAQPRFVHQPGDYLLAYWMGRYYGFIPEGI